jgi:hypothetical protein
VRKWTASAGRYLLGVLAAEDTNTYDHLAFRLNERSIATKVEQNVSTRRNELLFERKQLPQVADNRHFRIERMERLEPGHIFRNQQLAGSIPAGGSTEPLDTHWIAGNSLDSSATVVFEAFPVLCTPRILAIASRMSSLAAS